jgi:hypothetical protein
MGIVEKTLWDSNMVATVARNIGYGGAWFRDARIRTRRLGVATVAREPQFVIDGAVNTVLNISCLIWVSGHHQNIHYRDSATLATTSQGMSLGILGESRDSKSAYTTNYSF